MSRATLDLLWEYASAVKVPNDSLTFILKGKKKVDVMYVHGTLFAINLKVAAAIESNDLKGAKTFPLKIAKCKETFFGLSVFGKAAKAKDMNKPRFDLKTWDGSDFFTVSDTQLMIVTARVFEAFNEAGITGVYYMPVQGV